MKKEVVVASLPTDGKLEEALTHLALVESILIEVDCYTKLTKLYLGQVQNKIESRIEADRLRGQGAMEEGEK
jgi:hypothetical protein